MTRFLEFLRREKRNASPQGPETVRIYAIGDIHGRLDLLIDLHHQILEDSRSAGDAQILQIFLGDYVDRGPDASGVVDWLLASPPEGWDRICLKGNHEAMLLDFLDNPQSLGNWQQYGGAETLHSYGVHLCPGQERSPESIHEEFLRKLPPNHLDFLSSLKLSETIGDYFFVHAGVRPYRRLDRQTPEDLLWIRHDFIESTEDFGKVVVHGHSPTESPEFLPNRINIDTGAYITGRLHALVLHKMDQRLLVAQDRDANQRARASYSARETDQRSMAHGPR